MKKLFLVSLLVLPACDIANQNATFNDGPTTVVVSNPCNTCPDGTDSTAVLACACTDVVRNGAVSSCMATWTGGPASCAWEGTRQDGMSDSGVVTNGGEIDPGPPGQGAGTWSLEICGCPATFEADS